MPRLIHTDRDTKPHGRFSTGIGTGTCTGIGTGMRTGIGTGVALAPPLASVSGRSMLHLIVFFHDAINDDLHVSVSAGACRHLAIVGPASELVEEAQRLEVNG